MARNSAAKVIKLKGKKARKATNKHGRLGSPNIDWSGTDWSRSLKDIAKDKGCTYQAAYYARIRHEKKAKTETAKSKALLGVVKSLRAAYSETQTLDFLEKMLQEEED